MTAEDFIEKCKELGMSDNDINERLSMAFMSPLGLKYLHTYLPKEATEKQDPK